MGRDNAEDNSRLHIAAYYWSGRPDGGTGSPKYGAAGFPDVNAGMMFSLARVKGGIDTLPERPGVILYCGSSPHVGIYAGNGDVIECTLSARGDGVVRTRLGDFGWEYWFECPYISYPKAAPQKSEKTYSAGDRVYIRTSARCYSGTGVAIPSRFKGRSRTYTVSKTGNGRVLLKELFSWVDVSDVLKIENLQFSIINFQLLYRLRAGNAPLRYAVFQSAAIRRAQT